MHDAPGWLVSLGIHLLALLILLAFKFHAETQSEASILNSIEDIQNEMNFDSASTDDQVGTDPNPDSFTSGGNGTAVAAAALAATGGPSVSEQISQKVDTDFKGPEIKIQDDSFALPSREDLGHTVEFGGGGVVENVAGEGGGAGNGEGGVGKAIDRLTYEIIQSLHERATTVIWLFDRSLSLKARRDAIADRFENVYRQLESQEAGGKGALTTVVATYGEKFALMTDKPIEDVRPLIPKVHAIPNDESGIENVFSAVQQLATKFRSERKKNRNVRIFIVTDEKGDDAEKFLEESLKLCKNAGIKVYVVGNAAPFGREKGIIAYTDTDGSTEDREIDAGPETFEPEALAMGFWGDMRNDLSRMSSGYGPYALTRLCKETGGLYFIAQEDAKGQRFSPGVMRNYQPDYRPIKDYQLSLSKNKAKASLVMASKQSKIETIALPQLGFQAYNDTILREQLTEAQKPAAELIYKINRIVELIEQGEKDRDKVSEPRWRAAYDLAIGRALAMKARAQGYNQMLADMKGTPKTFQNKDSNEWRIVPSKTINAGQAVKKDERRAVTYLKRVIDEHPDTPWATLAERELSIAMGWEWHERRNPSIFPAKTTPEEARRQIRLAEDRAREEAKKRPQPKPAKEKAKL